MRDNNQLRIATYNIQFGINTKKIIASIEKLALDGATIICIQEIIINTSQELIVDTILKRLGENWHASYHVGKENSRLSIGTCILWNSRFLEFINDEKILLPKLKAFDFHEKIFYKCIGVPAIPVQRKTTICYFKINKKVLRITNLHIDNVGGPLQRMKQITYLQSHLNKLRTPDYEVICGDFNTFDLLRTGYERTLLQKKFGKDFVDASKDVGWTSDIYNIDFKTSIKFFPWIIKTFNIHIRSRLDYIWVKNLKVISCKKVILPGSDHYPVIADVKI